MGTKLVHDLNHTLDQLIQNAEAMDKARNLTDIEKTAFEKTQESLLHHLLYVDQKMASNRNELKQASKKEARYQLREKVRRFKKLNGSFIKVARKARVL